MKKHLAIFAFALALPLALATSALSAERKLFDAKSFAEAQSNGAPILVDISASWCPTCKAQKPIIDSIAEQPENKTLVIFAVDFDSSLSSENCAPRAKARSSRSKGGPKSPVQSGIPIPARSQLS
jgi:thioredoxin 1